MNRRDGVGFELLRPAWIVEKRRLEPRQCLAIKKPDERRGTCLPTERLFEAGVQASLNDDHLVRERIADLIAAQNSANMGLVEIELGDPLNLEDALRI